MSVAPAKSATVLDLQGASFGYAGHAVVTDLTAVITSGEVVALLGPNGSGKSTLVRGLLGLTEHLGGQVQVLGHPLASVPAGALGYVPQRHTLSGSVRSTVREVVATGRLTHRPWWRPAGPLDRKVIDQALDIVGLAHHARSDVATLSGGQQRRVLIARALASEPSVLLMDEPTAGVDAASQEVLASVLHRLADTGVTMIVVTHELAALRGVIGRILEVESGRLHFDGTPGAYADHVAEQAHAVYDGHHHDDDTDDVSGQHAALLQGPYDTSGPRP